MGWPLMLTRRSPFWMLFFLKAEPGGRGEPAEQRHDGSGQDDAVRTRSPEVWPEEEDEGEEDGRDDGEPASQAPRPGPEVSDAGEVREEAGDEAASQDEPERAAHQKSDVDGEAEGDQAAAPPRPGFGAWNATLRPSMAASMPEEASQRETRRPKESLPPPRSRSSSPAVEATASKAAWGMMAPRCGSRRAWNPAATAKKYPMSAERKVSRGNSASRE